MKIFVLTVLCAIGCARLATCGDVTDQFQTEAQALLAEAENIKKVTKHDESIAAAALKHWKDAVSSNLLFLTDKTFPETVDMTTTLVLFYYPWDAKSQLSLQAFSKAADTLKNENFRGAALAAVNCFDFTYLCQRRGVLNFPSVLVYSGDGEPERYSGVIAPSALMTAAKRYAAGSMEDDMEGDKFEELSALRFPSLLALKKPFVVVFTHGKSITLVPIVESVASKIGAKEAIFTWMDTSKKDGVAKNILDYHVSDPKSEELLVIDHGKGTVHRFTGSSITADTVQKWVSGVLHGEVSATKELTKSDWKPRVRGYNFLRLMDLEMKNKPKLTETDLYINRLNEEGLSAGEDPIPRFILTAAKAAAQQVTSKTEL